MTTTDIKITRSVPALEKMVGSVAPFDQLKALVREDMKRVLTPQERQQYRGITHTGAPWLMFDELFHVETTEDVIRAEECGVYHSPADCPGESYLFACEMGLVARVHPTRAAQLLASSKEGGDADADAGGHSGSKKTRDELHAEYKEAKLGPKNWEEIFDEVAGDYVKWAGGHE
ncbi:hypothetical protein E4U43_002078 [Claviceps pusilla]|uniref:Uncharacterized protein n=1 Tax=Claviceps pusilla TaxID=123648 RepID=A0A9P7N6Q9_9HYPO|nr:hypothetical protein E4U43_002078 [Claviceps pusilla]